MGGSIASRSCPKYIKSTCMCHWMCLCRPSIASPSNRSRDELTRPRIVCRTPPDTVRRESLAWKASCRNSLMLSETMSDCASRTKLLFRSVTMYYMINILRPRPKGHHFPDDIFKCIFLNGNVWIVIKISLKYVPKVSINNIQALVQIMA